jgi:hypothetical protein
MKILAAVLLILLPDAFAFAMTSAPSWWSDSKCGEAREESFFHLMSVGYSYGKAIELTEKPFKMCLCSSGTAPADAINSLMAGEEVEIMMPDARILTVPVEYPRDFSIMMYKNTCYLKIDTPELCGGAFEAKARQYFNLPEINCVTDDAYWERYDKY